MGGCDDVDVFAGPGGFGAAAFGADEAFADGIGADRGGERAGNGPD
jgi:hypothetical protein